MREDRPSGTTAPQSLAVKYPALKAFPEVLERLDILDAMVEAAEAHASHWEERASRYFKLIEAIWIEELNGVLCHPPTAGAEILADGFPGIPYPDVDAPESRTYCGSCRHIWRRISAAIREHDVQTASATALAPKNGLSP